MDIQELRKKGYWVVLKKRTKLLLKTKSEEKALDFARKQRLGSGVKAYAPLVKLNISKEDIKQAEEMYKKGQMCNFG